MQVNATVFRLLEDSKQQKKTHSAVTFEVSDPVRPSQEAIVALARLLLSLDKPQPQLARAS